MGFGKSNKKNTLNYPRYDINKVSGEEFELEIDVSSLDRKDIKITIVPINCDHMILWLMEAMDKDTPIFSGLLTDVDDNSGFWFVESEDQDSYKINLDINKDSLVYKGMTKRWFSLSPISDNFNGVYKIIISKL